MTLSTTRQLIEAAQRSGTAVAAFNVIQLEHAQGIVAGAEQAGDAVILQLSENTVAYHGGPRAIAKGMRAVAESAGVPVALHLDHLTQTDLCRRTADLGFSSFMIDAAALPYERNVAVTSDAAAFARGEGLWVEAELGEVGGKGAHQTGARTSASEAAAFVADTGVDGLAVAIGSTHAMHDRSATLDLELLRRIDEAVPVPLVLHGSSGVRPDDLLAATRNGIVKVNVGTQLNIAFTDGVRRALADAPGRSDPRLYLGAGRTALAARVAGTLGELRPDARDESRACSDL
ncbi:MULTISPECIES: class II fructose-bisphosphate aldolase [unclassified Microbacterium]|uniref:class II fructose-bisphosphate aldolase n=1 Tax=unclassified Microbacterium TaxID=2609290 RepID=UPI00301AFFBD